MDNSRFKNYLFSSIKSECYSIFDCTLSKALHNVHNHPSGKLAPSDADIQITRKIKEASKILDITLLDHLIIRQESYSFADESTL